MIDVGVLALNTLGATVGTVRTGSYRGRGGVGVPTASRERDCFDHDARSKMPERVVQQ